MAAQSALPLSSCRVFVRTRRPDVPQTRLRSQAAPGFSGDPRAARQIADQAKTSAAGARRALAIIVFIGRPAGLVGCSLAGGSRPMSSGAINSINEMILIECRRLAESATWRLQRAGQPGASKLAPLVFARSLRANDSWRGSHTGWLASWSGMAPGRRSPRSSDLQAHSASARWRQRAADSRARAPCVASVAPWSESN